MLLILNETHMHFVEATQYYYSLEAYSVVLWTHVRIANFRSLPTTMFLQHIRTAKTTGTWGWGCRSRGYLLSSSSLLNCLAKYEPQKNEQTVERVLSRHFRAAAATISITRLWNSWSMAMGNTSTVPAVCRL